jgi:glycosyltransferase involved in cell wall biosynthesis
MPYSKDNQLVVVVQMLTYNHGPYIAQAIEAVIGQQTDFAYKIFVCDDCSTDDTRSICRDYAARHPDKITLMLNEHNLGVSRNAMQMHKACFDSGATYVAVCEGDDYWTDPLKLQKQVDFLDSHPHMNICWTRYGLEQGNEVTELDWSDPMFAQPETEITLTNIFDINRTHPLTVLWRRTAIDYSFLSGFRYSKDITLYAIAMATGRGTLLNFKGANYRLHSGGTYSAVGEVNQNFQNYLSLKEMIEKIPACDIEYMHIRMMWSLERAIYLLCNNAMDAKAYKQLWTTHLELFKVAGQKRKLYGLKELARQTFRRIRTQSSQ